MKNVKNTAKKIAAYGTRGDKILAHINPQEARLLDALFGSDKNPLTGLPQYGLFGNLFGKKRYNENTGQYERTGLRKMAYGLHGLEKAVRPVAKIALPIVGSLGGGVLGGPLGQVLGGAVGGALSSKSHPLDHALGGAAVGIGTATLGPMIGRSLGIDSKGLLGKGLGMNSPSLMSQLGIGRGDMIGGGLGLSQLWSKGNKGAQRQSGEGSEEAGGLSALGSMVSNHGQSGSNPSFLSKHLDKLLLGTMAAGTLLGKTKEAKQEPLPIHQHKDLTVFRHPGKKRRMVAHQNLPTTSEQKSMMEFFRKGGYVSGDEGGQDDSRRIDIPEGSYVWDATTVSLLGDGNSLKGKRDIKQLEDSFLRTGIINSRYLEGKQRPQKVIHALVSDGEMISPPEVVKRAGNGSNARGGRVFDRVRKNLRKDKGLKTFLPPKSKPITAYLKD